MVNPNFPSEVWVLRDCFLLTGRQYFGLVGREQLIKWLQLGTRRANPEEAEGRDSSTQRLGLGGQSSLSDIVRHPW